MDSQIASYNFEHQLLLKYEPSSRLIRPGQEIGLELVLEQIGDMQQHKDEPPVLLAVLLDGFRCVGYSIPEKFKKYIVGDIPAKNWFPCYLDIPVKGEEGLITKASPKIVATDSTDQLEIRIFAFYNGSLIKGFERLRFELQKNGSYILQ